jgi:hypothetical protein
MRSEGILNKQKIRGQGTAHQVHHLHALPSTVRCSRCFPSTFRWARPTHKLTCAGSHTTRQVLKQQPHEYRYGNGDAQRKDWVGLWGGEGKREKRRSLTARQRPAEVTLTSPQGAHIPTTTRGTHPHNHKGHVLRSTHCRGAAEPWGGMGIGTT